MLAATTIRIYVPTATPVQAVSYSDPASLRDIQTWVQHLHDRRLISSGVHLTITHHDDSTPVGTLHDPVHGRDLLLPGNFLVFSDRRLRVVEEPDFHRAYREPPGTAPRR